MHYSQAACAATTPPITPTDDSRSGSPPGVVCQVRARLPSVHGQHHVLLYHDTTPDPLALPPKDHLAIVYGPRLARASKSLRAVREGESASDLVIRGFPGDDEPLFAMRSAPNAHPSDAIDDGSIPLVRVHSECFTGETLGSRRCDCGEQLTRALRLLDSSASGGVLLYLRQEGRGIGLLNKLRAYNLQDLGHDTVAANELLGHPIDARDYSVAAHMLHDLGIKRCLLLTNNPEKVRALESFGVEVVQRIPMVPSAWSTGGAVSLQSGVDGVSGVELDKYLTTKILRMGHHLALPERSG